MHCDKCGRQATVFQAADGGDWQCWRCRWPGARAAIGGAVAEARWQLEQAALRIRRAVSGAFWRVVFRHKATADRIGARGFCPRCGDDTFGEVYRHAARAGFVFWGWSCDECELELERPGFTQRAAALRQRFANYITVGRVAG